MSAQSFDVATCLFPDPSWTSGAASNPQCLGDAVSFIWTPNYAIRTLSTTSAVTGQDVLGLLYVPDLDPSDPCNNLTIPGSNQTYVPANVTRQANLPHANYNLVAIAPWISPACTLSYLGAAQQDSPVRAMLFYKPNNDTNTPPIADDTQWDLGDGGSWKTKYQYPVYAIPGPTGSLFMQNLASYSGNMTSVPFGSTLVKSYDSTNYVRLYAHISVGSYSSLPSLWVFLLIVLGILALVIALTSVLMHYLQGRRRASLRRRVANGEVDLEALGIQRLTVPQDLLERMPLYEYGSGEAVEQKKPEANNKASLDEKEVSVARGRASKSRNNPQSPSTDRAARSNAAVPPVLQTNLHQPTCAICLDDFVESSPETAGTVVRQLPCLHIFHPDCVDTFLRDNSSLCPLCKKSSLPKGYCPKVVTNAMVRRERMVRRIRETVVVSDTDEENAHTTYDTTSQGGIRGLGRRVGTFGRRRTAPSAGTEQQMADLSSTAHPDPEPNGTSAPATTVSPTPPQNPATRREWAQQRAVAMLGRRTAPTEAETEDRRSGWRKVVGSVFPGMS